MNNDFKYGLTNASKFLKNFSQRIHEPIDQPDNIHQQTFQDQPKPSTTQLSNILIKKHLKQTFHTYQQDLKMLQENRNNLVEAIECITDKIHQLPQLKEKTQILQLENLAKKQQLKELIHEYHQLKLKLNTVEMEANERLQKQKNKLKLLMEVCPVNVDYGTQCQVWRQYSYWKHVNMVKDHQITEVNIPIKPKQEPKKLKKVDNTGLLGDLKMFAKNFKMPDK